MSKEVGIIIREARKRQGLTGRALSDTCGIGYSMVSSLEHGRRSPGVVSLLQLGSVLGTRLIADVLNQIKREQGL